MQNNLETFNGLWQSFITALKGSLRKLAADRQLDYKHAKAALTEQSLCWKGDYDAEGRWLNSLIKEDDARGKLVKRILTQDMQFCEISVPASNSAGLAIGAAGGGVVGYGIAALVDMTPFGTILTTLVAAALGGVLGRRRDVKSKYNAIEKTINEYASQLDTYYHSVIAALNA